MCGYFCIEFIDFILKDKRLLDSINLFSPSEYWKEWWNNTKIFSVTNKRKKLYCVICVKYREFEKSKISYIFEKALDLSVFPCKCKNEDEKISE